MSQPAAHASSELWWLPDGFDVGQLRVGVGHHEPVAEDESSASVAWLHALDGSADEPLYGVDVLSQWRTLWKDDNVYRLSELHDSAGRPVLIGPFLLDLDNDRDLGSALAVARAAFGLLRSPGYGIEAADVRVYFSGHKGFNLEVRPGALGIAPDSSMRSQLQRAYDVQQALIGDLRRVRGVRNKTVNAVDDEETYADRIYGPGSLRYSYIRLPESLNVWVDVAGNRVARRRLLLDADEIDRADLCIRR
jgi:hypothetical protein